MKDCICVFVCLSLCLTAGGQSVADAEFFAAMDLDYPGLQSVKICVLNKNITLAKVEYVKYLKNRSTPIWRFDWRMDQSEKRNTAANIPEADRYVKNDLVSCGIWHQFGPTVNWCLNPTRNNYDEWTWQLNRHTFWLTMGKAYWRTGDERYAKAFVSQLNSWIEQCKMPVGDCEYSGSAWRTLEAGIRMRLIWPDVFFYFLSSPSFDDESIFRMAKSFYEHATYLFTHRVSNYRLSHEMNGLYTVGVMFPEFRDADTWRTVAAEKLYEEEIDQFYPDGSQKELAPAYHGTNLSCIVSVAHLAQLNNYSLPSGYVSRLESIYEFYQKMIMPNGKLPAVNDSRWLDGRANLTEASNLFLKRRDFLYAATNGDKGEKPSYTSVWMPWAGWYVMRSGWDENAFYALFEVGPYGIGHQHEDKLSFIIYAYGSLLITECGNYAYDNSRWRTYAISARGHNVVRVDGEDQHRYGKNGVGTSETPLSNTWVSKRKYELGEGFYDDGFGDNTNQPVNITHHRILKFIKNRYWVLTDEFFPKDNNEHKYDIWFHLNTDNYLLDKSTNIVYSCNESGANIAIVRLGDNQEMEVKLGEQSPEIQGWVAEGSSDEGFNMRQVATPIYHSKGTGITREKFLFIPYPQGQQLRITLVKRLSNSKYRLFFDGGKNLTVKL